MECQIFYSGMAGAPTPSLAAGQGIALLDACLINGFNSISGITVTRSGAIATATYTAHGYVKGQLVTIAGAAQSDYNGDMRVQSVPDANTFTFTVANSPATPATGTITGKTTPLGWSKAYSGTNLAAYRAPAGNRRYLRVDDTPTNTIIVLGYDTMTAISTGTNPFPATTWAASSAYRWPKPLQAQQWVVVGDDRRFFLLGSAGAYGLYGSYSFFGDVPSYKSGDTDNTAILGCNISTDLTTSISQGSAFYTNQLGSAPAVANAYCIFRDATGLLTVGSTGAVTGFFGTSTSTAFVAATGIFNRNPSDITGGYHVSLVDLFERVTLINQPRFRLPGVVAILNGYDVVTNNRVVLDNLNGLGSVIAFGQPTPYGIAFVLGDWQTLFATGM